MTKYNNPVFRDAAMRYAQAEKSDPFAYNRAMSHIRSGVGHSADGKPVYDAEPDVETRYLPTGQAYEAQIWRNVSRG